MKPFEHLRMERKMRPKQPSEVKRDQRHAVLSCSQLSERIPGCSLTSTSKRSEVKMAEWKVGSKLQTTFYANPKKDSAFRFRATHADDERAPKAVLCNDPRVQPGKLCEVRVIAVHKPKSKDHGHFEVEYLGPVTFKLDDSVWVDPAVAPLSGDGDSFPACISSLVRLGGDRQIRAAHRRLVIFISYFKLLRLSQRRQGRDHPGAPPPHSVHNHPKSRRTEAGTPFAIASGHGTSFFRCGPRTTPPSQAIRASPARLFRTGSGRANLARNIRGDGE